MQSLLLDFEQQTRRREAADAERDPKRHRLTRVMTEGADTTYGFFSAGRDGRGAAIRFCVSRCRNAAGLFLFWRERQTRNGIKRDQWEAYRDKRLARSWARRRAEEWRRKRGAS